MSYPYITFGNAGNTYDAVGAKMAIYNRKCAYEVTFFVPEVPAEMYTVVDAETGAILLQDNVLPTLPNLKTFNFERRQGPPPPPPPETRQGPPPPPPPPKSLSDIRDVLRNEKGNITLIQIHLNNI